MALSTASPKRVSFIPRPEFIHQHDRVASSFALLTISNSSALRLYSFSASLISALRRFFDQYSLLTSFKEDIINNFCEYTLAGKPWNSSKSPATECLLVEILSILYHNNYSFQSTIDYGRDHDDRVALVFSQPSLSPSRLGSPANASSSSFPDKSKVISNVPFALSFPSPTQLRVVSPPLGSTPAILQAVRGSWPRGVVSEKKIGQNSFEFKLKGYRWFQEDTFATDSLQHILSLLSSLDAHSFTLLTSLNLTSRSRVKDLWIFTGPGSFSNDVENLSLPVSPEPSVMEDPRTKRSLDHEHRRYATDPFPINASLPKTPYPDAMTESPLGLSGVAHPRSASAQPPSPHNSDILRRAPRAQIPSSVHGDDAFRQSAVSDSPEVFYSTAPTGMQGFAAAHGFHSPTAVDAPDIEEGGFVGDTPAADNERPVLSAEAIPPLMADTERHGSGSSTSPGIATPPTPTELLGSGVFRDSAMSTNTDMSSEIPIKWTGPMESKSPALVTRQESLMPTIPGAWQPTPIEEKSEQDATAIEPQQNEEEIQAVTQRIQSPELRQIDPETRKSETGIVGVVDPAPVKPGTVNDEPPKEADPNKGWVLVNVDGREPSGNGEKSQEPVSPPEPQSAPQTEPPETNGPDSTPASTSQVPVRDVSPAAKAIVIMDAVDAKKKGRSSSAASPGARFRRLLSLSKKETVDKQR